MNVLRDSIKFESLVGEVLKAQGYRVTRGFQNVQAERNRVREIDILAYGNDGTVMPVEVKLGGSSNIVLRRLRDAASVAASLSDFAVKTRPLLVFGSDIEPVRREWAEHEFQIQIWDRRILLQNAKQYKADLAQVIDELAQPFQTGTDTFSMPPLLPSASEPIELVEEARPETRGNALIQELKGILPGKKASKDHEKTCQDIVTYLFGDDLKDGRSQKRTTDGINIYDLVYRVSPKHPFWLTLTRDFRARVVLFECKNYGKPIDAMQVFTTERYLSASALRPICFVISRKKPHPNAIQAASGAMRESGKLLVFLSDEDLFEMLRVKDVQLREGGTSEEMQANDPTEILDQAIYNFIAGMPR